jgi:hypothetical protein
MGNAASIANSNARVAVEQEFLRVQRGADRRGSGGDDDDAESPQRHAREYLLLHEVLALKAPQHLPIDFSDLGALYCLDADHDGRVTLAELHDFVALCAAQTASGGGSGGEAHQGSHKLSAFCAAKMWKDGIRTPSSCVAARADLRLAWTDR